MRLLQHVVDWCVGFLQDLSLGQMLLKGFDVMKLIAMMVTHVFLESSCMVFLNLPMLLRLCILLKTLNEGWIFLEQVKTHLKQVVVFEIVAEAFFLLICIDIAERLMPK